MQSIRTWALALCAAAVASALVHMIAPEGQKKVLSFTINLFVLLCLLAPLKQFSWPDTLPALADADELSQNALTETDALYTQEIQRRISVAAAEKLRTLGIIAQEIRINIIVSEEKFSIESVSVILDATDASKANQAAEALEEYLGLPVTAGANEVT